MDENTISGKISRFDEQYDKILIGNNDGEFYTKTVKEAKSKKFRRAFRYMGHKAGELV